MFGGVGVDGSSRGEERGSKTPAVCSPCTHAVICSASSQTLPPRSSYLVRGQKNRCNTRAAQILQQTVTSRIDGFLGAPPETLVTFLNVRRSTISRCLARVGERTNERAPLRRLRSVLGFCFLLSFFCCFLFLLDNWIFQKEKEREREREKTLPAHLSP